MLRRRILGVSALVLIALWVMIAHAPVYLPPVTPQMQAARATTPQSPQRVFGFATLTSPVVRFVVTGRHIPAAPAQLAGFRRVNRNIVPQEGTNLPGQVFTVSPDALLRLDRYERLGTRYRRDQMTLVDGSTAWVYALQ